MCFSKGSTYLIWGAAGAERVVLGGRATAGHPSWLPGHSGHLVHRQTDAKLGLAKPEEGEAVLAVFSPHPSTPPQLSPDAGME